MSRVQVIDQRAEIAAEFFDDRIGFWKEILNIGPTEQQATGLEALAENPYQSIKSGHGVGKSTYQAGNILHFMCTRPAPKIPCTAPSKHQLHDVLWNELHRLHKSMSPIFRGMFVWTKENFFHKDNPEWFAGARTATKENPEALQGFHAEHILRIIDEASAIPEPVFEVLEGATGTIETMEIMSGNPTRNNGNFFRSFNQDKDSFHRLTWSCLESPIVPARYIERIRRKYGEHSNMWRVRVIGEFPMMDGDTYIPFAWAMDAVDRDIPPQIGQPVCFGVDVARFGDDETVIAIRQGDEFKPLHTLRNKDTMEVVGYVGHLADEYAKKGMPPRTIFVDEIGLGAGVHDRLRELGYPVYGVNVSRNPTERPDKFKRLRDELWGKMRNWLESGRSKLHDNEDRDLVAQLTTPKYKILDSNGMTLIESKDDLKKRGVESPNRADAVILTFAQPLASYTTEDDLIDYMEDPEPPVLDPVAGY